MFTPPLALLRMLHRTTTTAGEYISPFPKIKGTPVGFLNITSSL